MSEAPQASSSTNTATENGTDSHSSSNTDTDTDTLYYDGLCTLCAAEIEELRQTRGDALALVDIHSLSATDEAADVDSRDSDTLLRVLHLKRSDGQWLTGADANVAAWEGTRRGRLLAVLRWPLIRYPVDLAYNLWAHWRYRRLYGTAAKESQRAAP